jgi:hypothetical protein
MQPYTIGNDMRLRLVVPVPEAEAGDMVICGSAKW